MTSPAFPPLCMRCKHYDKKTTNGLTCKAFPKGIPDSIVFNQQDHRKPIKGDNGIQFLNGSDMTDKEIDDMFKEISDT